MFIYLLLFIYMTSVVVLITWLYKSKKPFVIKAFYGLFILAYIGLFIYLMPQEIGGDIKPIFLYSMFILMIIGILASLLPIIGGIRALWRWNKRYVNGIILKSDTDVEQFIKAAFDEYHTHSIQIGKSEECFVWRVVLKDVNNATETVFISVKAKQKYVNSFNEIKDGDYKINGYKVKLENLKMYPLEIKSPSRK